MFCVHRDRLSFVIMDRKKQVSRQLFRRREVDAGQHLSPVSQRCSIQVEPESEFKLGVNSASSSGNDSDSVLVGHV